MSFYTALLIILGALGIYRSVTWKEFYVFPINSPLPNRRLPGWLGRPITFLVGISLWVGAWWL